MNAKRFLGLVSFATVLMLGLGACNTSNVPAEAETELNTAATTGYFLLNNKRTGSCLVSSFGSKRVADAFIGRCDSNNDGALWRFVDRGGRTVLESRGSRFIPGAGRDSTDFCLRAGEDYNSRAVASPCEGSPSNTQDWQRERVDERFSVIRYPLANGCLSIVSDVVIRPCDPSSGNQLWSFKSVN